MKPQCRITVDGKPVSGAFMERLISCEVTDKVGTTSDTVSIELHDFPPAIIPKKGAIISVHMGYENPAFMGTFTVDQISVAMFPHTMSISGKGTDLRKTMKEQKERSFDKKSIKDIATQIAGEHGLKPKIDASIGATVLNWIGQNSESDLEFLERIASDNNGLFAIKDGNLVFADRGAGKNAGGQELPKVVVTPERLIVGSAKVTFSDRTEVDEVKAKYYDRDEAEMFVIGESADG